MIFAIRLSTHENIGTTFSAAWISGVFLRKKFNGASVFRRPSLVEHKDIAIEDSQLEAPLCKRLDSAGNDQRWEMDLRELPADAVTLVLP